MIVEKGSTWYVSHYSPTISQRKLLVLVNGNKIKIDRQQHNGTSNFVSANVCYIKTDTLYTVANVYPF